MSILDDLTYATNVIERSIGFITALIHADWRHALNRGPGGTLNELGQTLIGANAWHIRVTRDAPWTGGEIEHFLRYYGVTIWNRGVTSQCIHFTVEKRQANWAEYLLLRRGIQVEPPLFNPQNAVYGQQHAPGDQPPAWAGQPARSHSRRSTLDRLLDLLS